MKLDIQFALKQYISTFPSQLKAAASLENVSEGTVIAIKNGNFKSISEKMWLNVGKQVGAFKRKSKLVRTADFQLCELYFNLAKEEGATFYITGGAGHGKTFSATHFAEANRKKAVFYLKCSALWNKKTFLANILGAMGRDSAGLNINEMMEAIIRDLQRQATPLIIFDEMDKLPDNVLMFFIILYNELNSLCGFVMLSTNQIEKRVMRGLNSNKTGYQEFWSRIGGKFINLSGVTLEELRAICQVNGIESEEVVRAIYNEARGDLRRVDRHFLKASAKNLRTSLQKAEA